MSQTTRQIRETFIAHNFVRENLKTNINNLHGEETFHQSRTFEKLRTKRRKLLCDLNFLRRCRDTSVIPVSMKLSFHTRTQTISKILKNASLALIRDAIRSKRRKLDDISRHLYDAHCHLASKLHPVLWKELDFLTNQRAEDNATLITERQQKKYNGLQAKQVRQTTAHQLDPTKVVHNLSDYPLDQATLSALAKGFNFAVAPSRVPTEDIITGVESAVFSLPEKEAETLRQQTCEILRKARPPPRNISFDEIQALKALRSNEEIIVLPADKGNATVVMNTSDYNTKMRALLVDAAYTPRRADPTTNLEKKTKALIVASPLDLEVKKYLIPREKSWLPSFVHSSLLYCERLDWNHSTYHAVA
jgi:hypothetical protein